ncbi:MAG TPA: UDP-N-acetylmuramoyl-L-alanine--D-glutamate ligase [Steroidobacteraceae bacterium]|nr:UDP-N-acetylmuramoyl-L-alanine--D-glutamate ligase [Steroidobacteraceae bacterium]
MSPEQIKPSSAVIAGLGRTGLACARYLRALGWNVAVTDSRENPPQLDELRKLDPQIPVRVGGLDTQFLRDAVCVIASPGLPLTDPFFQEARRRGLEVVGDIELFARAADAPVAGITGTNGKSTVTTLVGRMAERAGLQVRVGGNLGTPALDLLTASLSETQRSQLYVLELSSFQLEATTTLDLKAAAVLNVTPDHLDRYVSLEAYAEAKARIFARCDTAVINLDDPLVVAMPRPGQQTVSFSLRAAIGADYCVAERQAPAGKQWWLMRREEPLLPLNALKIKGLHNAANALAALALGEALALPLSAMLTELAAFPGLPHRSQWVADVRGVTYINDSKGTNVGATLAAVGGLRGPLIMIAGGDGKNQDFTPLAAAFRGKVRRAILIGRDAAAIEVAVRDVCPTERCHSLEEAVVAAARIARPGDTVLLSPACASLDMFRDYTHRGAVFEQAVKELAA